jgi:metacaspase-1
MATAKKSATKKLATKKSSANTPTALSLHIGLNFVDPQHYGGWDGELASCEFDAQDMAALASSRGMKASQLITQQATRNAVLAGIRKASSTLGSGDFFMLTFSGHGGQVDDVSGEDEDDKKDETWCLWDSQLIDDELYFELSKFAAGVRVLILSDSCHSGTVARNGPPPPDEMGLRKRMMPRAVAMRTVSSTMVCKITLPTLRARPSSVTPMRLLRPCRCKAGACKPWSSAFAPL